MSCHEAAVLRIVLRKVGSCCGNASGRAGICIAGFLPARSLPRCTVGETWIDPLSRSLVLTVAALVAKSNWDTALTKE